MRPCYVISTTNFPVSTGLSTVLDAGSEADLKDIAERLAARSFSVVMLYDRPALRPVTRKMLEIMEDALRDATVLLAHQDPAAGKTLPDAFMPQEAPVRRPDGRVASFRHRSRRFRWMPSRNPTEKSSLEIFPSHGRFSRWAIGKGLEPTIVRLAPSPRRSRALYEFLTR